MPDSAAPAPLPDAVLIPGSMRAGNSLKDRISSICEIAEPILGLDRSQGQTAWLANTSLPADDGSFLVLATRKPNETHSHPIGSPKERQPRHRWEKRADGVRLGYLLEDDGASA